MRYGFNKRTGIGRVCEDCERHFLCFKTYLQTYDNTQSRYVPLELFPDQDRLIYDYDNFEENIALSIDRQVYLQ